MSARCSQCHSTTSDPSATNDELNLSVAMVLRDELCQNISWHVANRATHR